MKRYVVLTLALILLLFTGTASAGYGCKHTNKTLVWSYHDVYLPEAWSSNDEAHLSVMLYNLTCNDCGCDVTEMDEEWEAHTFEQRTDVIAGGKVRYDYCTGCGESFHHVVVEGCSHRWEDMYGRSNPLFDCTVLETWYEYTENVGDDCHTEHRMRRVYCNACGEIITKRDMGYSWEECSFVNGTCAKCGNVQNGYIPTTATPAPSPTPRPATPTPAVTMIPAVPTKAPSDVCQHVNPARIPIGTVVEYCDEQQHTVTTTYQIVCQCGAFTGPNYHETIDAGHVFVNNQCRDCHCLREFRILSPNELIRSEFNISWTRWEGAHSYTLTMQNMTTGEYIFQHHPMIDAVEEEDVVRFPVSGFAQYKGMIGCDGMRIMIEAMDRGGRVLVSDTADVDYFGYSEHEYNNDDVCVHCYQSKEGVDCSLTQMTVLGFADVGAIPAYLFEAENIVSIYYLRSVYSKSHTALLMVDAQGRGLHMSYYGDGTYSGPVSGGYTSIALDVFPAAEMQQIFQTGGVYNTPLSNSEDSVSYLNYYDMIDIACLFTSYERTQAAYRCLDLFKYAHEYGFDYDAITQNCDDLAYYALYGEESLSVFPNGTFEKLWKEAESKGGVYRRIEHPNMGPDTSDINPHIERYDAVLDNQAAQGEQYSLVIVKQQAMLRAAPDVKSDYVGTAEAGERLAYLNTVGNWYRVSYEGGTVYIHKDRVELE